MRAGTHHELCIQLKMFGTSGIMYQTSKKVGEALGVNCGGRSGSVQWERQGGRQTWQADLSDDPRKLQRQIYLTIDLIGELYIPKIARDSMDDGGEEWGCRQCRKRHSSRLQAIQVVKGCPKGGIVKHRNAQGCCKKNLEGGRSA